jgi:ubiquinone/menaquinone biosynthesis C-methylase UbiE
MDKIDLIPRIKELYEKGGNIIEYLRNDAGRNFNTVEDILISYDFQAGSYIKFVGENPAYIEAYTSALSKVFAQLGSFESILEVGVGEATTLGHFIPKLENRRLKVYGFDISWSRIDCGRRYLDQIGINAGLFVADLFNIPMKDSSIDIVYTSHSVEPNGGREREAIRELYRVANRYLVLLEPTSEFANDDGKNRMKKNGYVQNLATVIKELNYDLIEYRPFDISANPMNTTGLYIVKKEADRSIDPDFNFCCPISKTPLKEYGDHFFSPESFISYPKIKGIPCLCPIYGILTSKHGE